MATGQQTERSADRQAERPNIPSMSRRVREYVLIFLGVITPIGILAVNASAFVMAHLVEFRWVIAGCALVSGLVLNGLTAWWLLGLASRTAAPLYREYRTWALGAAILIVLLTAGGGGYLTYLGMQDPKRLPDALSVIAACFMLFLPLAVTFAARRMAGLGANPFNPQPRKKRSPPPKRGAHS